MNTLNIVTAPISEEKIEYVKAFLNALKIQFNVSDITTSENDFVNDNDKKDWWDNLSSKEQNTINESVSLLEKGEAIAHSEIRKGVNSLLGKDE